ncbi:multidrug efflux system integral membrane protein [Bordetella trematum]|nr:multidrug efflux system integral membrane protein [Bordetella trematum]
MVYERARFIEASISEVMHTLTEAVLIVVVVIWLCLGSLRSVIIPVVAIPLSMLGAAALMLAFGFSINLLTLLAMVLAIGLVVDDAIVVVENVHRHIEEGKSPVAAALVGAREIAGPVVAMTLTLAAVYAPIGLMGGLTGALFREFALTLAGAVVVSGIVALTLSPVMSSLLLASGQQEGRMARMAEHVFGGLSQRYGRILQASLKRRWISGAVAVLVCLSLPLLYQLPKRELAPAEDQAAVLAAVKSPNTPAWNMPNAFPIPCIRSCSVSRERRHVDHQRHRWAGGQLWWREPVRMERTPAQGAGGGGPTAARSR